ncbi:MAG: A/G-specific adenine glycosylase [Methanomicrobiales archaeon]|nr:A/G-specific adenine glycosylase [Methanomicrobiales archaeon]
MKTRQTSLSNGQSAYHRDDPDSIAAFQGMVISYYADHGRDLPWRHTTVPYRILVSEIMLQQTQVGRVLEKYPAFLEAFPDFPALAGAPLTGVLAQWQGMGYNRRAIALQKCAARVVTEFHRELPADVEILSTFPGIGRATASSICAFAFNMPVVFIETNIRRVFIHFFFADRETVDDTELLPVVERALDRKNPCQWYNALMDLGTDLKTRVPNPNRRSRQYTKQSAFEGSDRKIRGEILRLLLAEKRMSKKAVCTTFPEEPERIERILGDLEREGFVTRSGNFVMMVE